MYVYFISSYMPEPYKSSSELPSQQEEEWLPSESPFIVIAAEPGAGNTTQVLLEIRTRWRNLLAPVHFTPLYRITCSHHALATKTQDQDFILFFLLLLVSMHFVSHNMHRVKVVETLIVKIY